MKENKILEKLLDFGRKVIPKGIFRGAQPIYHYILAVTGAIIYRFPAKKLKVIGVTGTKGKSTTTELMNAILESAGYKTALASTIRYKIGDRSWDNMFKMTLRGRFFTQSFLKQAVDAGCEYAVIELSSEGVKQYRHKFLYLDALIFTNLAPEHIESHGSYENYVNAKLDIARELENSKKEDPAIIVNVDDNEADRFLGLNIKNKISYSLKDAFNIHSDENSSSFQIDKTVIYLKIAGTFNILNSLGAIACAKHFGAGEDAIKKGLESVDKVRGRMERIWPTDLPAGRQEFDVVVDYAHTPESLKAIYETYKSKKTICILGNTGGGRDKWKREEMGKIADEYCGEIILTNEDPYDEDPMEIVMGVKNGIKNKKVEIIMDRREAIRLALKKAFELAHGKPSENIAVLITGKGTDPYIMGPNGSRERWDDASVTREELEKLLYQDPNQKVYA